MAEPIQLQLSEPFVDREGQTWFVQPHLRVTPRGTVEGWVRFVGRDGRILSAGPIVFAESRQDAEGWESALVPERISQAFGNARFDGAFSRSALLH